MTSDSSRPIRNLTRRRVVIGAGAALGGVGVRGVVRAQPSPYRLLYLTDGLLGPPPPALFEAFRDGLRELGYSEGREVVIHHRHAPTPEDRKVIAADLGQMKPHIVVTDATAVFEFKEALRPFPVVFAAFSDPVGAGFAATLARPGGNMTGLSYAGLELNPKRLEILKETVPRLMRVGILAGPHHPTRPRQERDIRAAAERLKLQPVVVDVVRASSRSVGRSPNSRSSTGCPGFSMSRCSPRRVA